MSMRRWVAQLTDAHDLVSVAARNFSRELRRERRAGGFGQKEVAARAGISEAWVSRIESGSKLSPRIARRIADALEALHAR